MCHLVTLAWPPGSPLSVKYYLNGPLDMTGIENWVKICVPKFPLNLFFSESVTSPQYFPSCVRGLQKKTKHFLSMCHVRLGLAVFSSFQAFTHNSDRK